MTFKIIDNSILKKINFQYNKSQKFKYEKNLFLYRIYRPISFYIAIFFIFFKVKPNFITFLNFLLIIASHSFFLKGDLLLGSLFLLLSVIFDLTDGNLARYYKSNNSFGKIADGLVDSFVFLTFFFYAISLVINEQKIYNVNFTLLIGALTSISYLFKMYFDVKCSFVLIRDKKRNRNITKCLLLEKKKNFFNKIKKLVNEFYLGIPIFLIFCIIAGHPSFGLIFYFFLIFFLSNLEILFKLFILWKKFNK
jgi:phosphatidylglycerophosphate synthase